MTIGIMACVSELELPYIREWIDWHVSLGISQFWLILDNFDFNKRADFISRISECQADIILIDNTSTGSWQTPMYNRTIWETIMPDPHCPDRLFVLDVDEFVKLRKCDFLSQQRRLSDILSEHQHDLALNWRIYGSSGLDSVQNNDYSVLKRFRRCSSTLNPHVKICLDLRNPTFRFFICPHCLNYHCQALSGKDVTGPFNKREPDEIDEIEIAHYATKSREECKIRRQHKRADTGQPRGEGWGQFFIEHDVNDIDEVQLYD